MNTIPHPQPPVKTATELLADLEAERQAHKATAEHFERRALAALAANNFELWEHFAHEADVAWKCNPWCVAELDRLATLAEASPSA